MKISELEVPKTKYVIHRCHSCIHYVIDIMVTFLSPLLLRRHESIRGHFKKWSTMRLQRAELVPNSSRTKPNCNRREPTRTDHMNRGSSQNASTVYLIAGARLLIFGFQRRRTQTFKIPDVLNAFFSLATGRYCILT